MNPTVTQTVCKVFQPPTPMRMSAYFDDVTGFRDDHIMRYTIKQYDNFIDRIFARSDPAEIEALLYEFDARMAAFGDINGYFGTENEYNDNNESAQKTVEIIVYDILGRTRGGVDDRVVKEFKSHLTDFIKSGLNSKGKKALELTQFMADLADCKNTEDVAVLMGKTGSTALAAWTAKNWEIVFKKGAKFIGITPVVRNRVAKWVALRLAFAGAWGKRLAIVTKKLNFLSIILADGGLASYFVMNQNTFLLYYSRVSTTQRDIGRRGVCGVSSTGFNSYLPTSHAIDHLHRSGPIIRAL